MATTVPLDSAIVRALQEATNEPTRAAAVRKALQDYLRRQKLQGLADLAGAVDLVYTNEELEAAEE